MKIYKHEYSLGGKKIRTSEYEAEEKAKTYVVGRQRVFKMSIGRLSGGYFKEMWTLTPDTTEFINALIADNNNRIETARKSLIEFEEERTMLEAELKKKYTEEGK